MLPSRTATHPLLEEEARAFRDLASEDYDRAISAMLDAAAAPPRSRERSGAFLDLADATLRRHGPTLAGSRGRCAVHLVAARLEKAERGLRERIDLLFLKVWLELVATVERGPMSIASHPPLPYGALLPSGADPDCITDPALREEARVLEALWHEELDRWRGKQYALHAMTDLAVQLLFATYPEATADQRNGARTLARMMTGPPIVPANVQELLEEILGVSRR